MAAVYAASMGQDVSVLLLAPPPPGRRERGRSDEDNAIPHQVKSALMHLTELKRLIKTVKVLFSGHHPKIPNTHSAIIHASEAKTGNVAEYAQNTLDRELVGDTASKNRRLRDIPRIQEYNILCFDALMLAGIGPYFCVSPRWCVGIDFESCQQAAHQQSLQAAQAFAENP